MSEILYPIYFAQQWYLGNLLFSCVPLKSKSILIIKFERLVLFVSAKLFTVIQMVGVTLIHCWRPRWIEMKWNVVDTCSRQVLILWTRWNEKLMIKHWNVLNFLVFASLLLSKGTMVYVVLFGLSSYVMCFVAINYRWILLCFDEKALLCVEVNCKHRFYILEIAETSCSSFSSKWLGNCEIFDRLLFSAFVSTQC